MLYDRDKAVSYAKKWAFSRNPRYMDFTGMGGDCTNFVSQCLHAGGCRMNYTPTFGWYYISITQRAPAWTGVEYFYKFIVNNKKEGPYGALCDISEIETGDVVQISFNGYTFSHSTIVVKIIEPRNLDNILISTHSYDACDKPLSQYGAAKKFRFIHILGCR